MVCRTSVDSVVSKQSSGDLGSSRLQLACS